MIAAAILITYYCLFYLLLPLFVILEDIQVVFFEESKERDFWTDNGIFGSADVHHQVK